MFVKKQRSRGSVLIVSTLALSALAGLSIATLQNVVTEYQITGQAKDKVLATQAAHYALAEGKRTLLTYWSAGATACAQRTACTSVNGNILVWDKSAFNGNSDLTNQSATFFDAANTTASSAYSPYPSVAKQPQFFVISLGCDRISKTNRYRIIAKGYGAATDTVAYAESTVTVPLSAQNSSVGAPTYTVYGYSCTSNCNAQGATWTQSVPYQLAYSTSSAYLFYSNPANNTNCPQGIRPGTGNTNMGVSCEMNCMGEIRVKAYSAYNSANCPMMYGDWVSGSNYSVLDNIQNNLGETMSVACGPASPSCTGGQTWQGPMLGCLCPTGQGLINGICVLCTNGTVVNNQCTCSGSNPYWDGSQCTVCPAGQYNNNGSCSSCAAGQSSQAGGLCTNCPAGQSSSAGGQCTNCPANSYSVSGGSCIPCPSGSTSNAGAGSCTCPSGQTWNGASCTNPCTGGQTWNGSCCAGTCSGGRTWSCSNGGQCVCPSGSSWHSSSNCCRRCTTHCSGTRHPTCNTSCSCI